MNLAKEHPKLTSVWNNMKQRCRNVNSQDFKHYGARGIKVCDEWNKLDGFLTWAYDSGYKEGLQIDRIDNDGDYCPSNCHFVTAIENNDVGKRRMMSNNSSGYIGVRYNKTHNKWVATIGIERVNKHLGFYSTIEEALAARIGAEILLFGKQMTNKT